jgi:hypothetical protein
VSPCAFPTEKLFVAACMHLTSPYPTACALSSFFITIYWPPLPLSLPHPPVSYQTFSLHYIVIPNDRVSGFVKLSLGALIMLSLIYNFCPNLIQGIQGILSGFVTLVR